MGELNTILAIVALTASGVNAFVSLKVQRDLARFETTILEKLNGRYISRREADLIHENLRSLILERK